jgi:thiol-disulfide isomerase/thioredoxin
VNKPLLNVSIMLTGILLGVLHYKLKPAPDEKQIAEYAQNMSNSTEWRGRIAPDFELKTTRGNRFQVSENVGKKIIVLNFFATWCGPCREEMPELNRYFNEHKAEPFLLVGIDAEEKQDRVDEFLKDLKVDFPAGIDEGPIRKQYNVTAFPTTVLIGVDGKVQFYETSALVNAEVAFDNLVQQNRQLLQAGKMISPEQYRLEAQKQPALPVLQAQGKSSAEEEFKLDPRGTRIAARMDCPCGCEQKVQPCKCNTSTKIKKALASEDYKTEPDDEIIRSLNKRFCSGGM